MATKTDFSDTLAKWLSILLGPHVWLPVLFFLIIFNSGLTPGQLKIIFPTVFLLDVVIPIAYLVFGPRLGWLKSWEMKEIKERNPFMYTMLVLAVISLGIIYFLGNKLLLDLALIYLVCIVVLLLITRFWKISLHVGLNVLAAVMINFIFGWKAPLLYLIIPIIFWARWRLKRHTLAQLFAGFLVMLAILFGGLSIFRYI